jgi:prepilin-type N-terminal cleavage/methylation domain-containing protein
MVARRLRGFTLIELLISIAILSMLIGLSTFGFSLFSRHWNGLKSGFDGASGGFQRVDLVSRALSDALPWIVRDEKERPGFYFLGREEGLTMVTGSPVYAVGSPAVIRLFREQQSNGLWRLVYEEASLEGVLLQRSEQILPFKHRLIVVDELSGISFRYFGWATSIEAMGADVSGPSVPPRWWDEFDGLKRTLQPLRVEFRLGAFNAVFDMPDRTSTVLGRATPVS